MSAKLILSHLKEFHSEALSCEKNKRSNRRRAPRQVGLHNRRGRMDGEGWGEGVHLGIGDGGLPNGDSRTSQRKRESQQSPTQNKLEHERLKTTRDLGSESQFLGAQSHPGG